MKPWLFDILACPIDKFYPLKLYIFSYETKVKDFSDILEIYQKRDVQKISSEKIVKISKSNNKYYIKDNIIIEKSIDSKYFELLLSSINELNHIIDKSNNEISKKCLNLILNEVKTNILEFVKKIDMDKIDKILPELYFVNKIKTEIEIESGLIFCEKCKRWYPIVETIPQMLPDEYRDENKEIEILKTNKNLLGDEFLKQSLKPFNI